MKKFIALLLTMALMSLTLTACGGGEGGISPTEQPTPTPKVLYQNPLTGLEQSFDYPEGQRPVAVMINNIMQYGSEHNAWPQSGLSAADVIYEMEVEGGITRLMAIFRDYTTVPKTGPVRSARDQFVQMMFPTSSIYIHEGESTYARTMLETYQYHNRELEGSEGVAYWDSSITDRAREHTAFTTGQLIQETIDSVNREINTEEEPAMLFNWVDYDVPNRELNGINVNEIAFDFSTSYSGVITYDAVKNTYTKTHTQTSTGWTNGLIDAGAGGALVEFDNVFVLWTTVENYPGDYVPEFSLSFGGVGYYFNGGKVEKVLWAKGMPEEPLRIVSLDGSETPIEVNPGVSYITMVDLDNYDSFTFDGVSVDSKHDYTTPLPTATPETTATVEPTQAP